MGAAKENGSGVVEIALDTLSLDEMTCGWNEALANCTVEETPLTINGKVFARGVGTHANSSFTIKLDGRGGRFRALVGVDDEVLRMGEGSARFLVYADDRLVADSGVVKSRQDALPIEADLRGAATLRIEAIDELYDTHLAHANWVDAAIELAPGFDALPVEPHEIIRLTPQPDYAPERSRTPSMHYPRIVGGTPERDFVFRIPATGEGPLSFAAQGLPDSLHLDSTNGVIRGTVPPAGTHAVSITVNNAHGSVSEKLTIESGKNKLCRTPPMGWNSWNVWGLAVDHKKVQDAADMLVQTGLAAHGYQSVNIDDGWEAGRAADGTILTNEKFPDMCALSEYVHSLGLRFGIYSSPGPKTCGGYTGSYQHELQDAETYASWGVDFLKYDWCSYNEIALDRSIAECQKPYRVMQDALAKQNRDIVYSLCQYGFGKVHEWGAEVGGNLWRTTGDIVDKWISVRTIGFRQDTCSPFGHPGGWNDPDMLVLGKVGWGPKTHYTNLTRHEQVTHMSLWCLLAAPLLIGCDLCELDDWTLAVLTNSEAIAIDQDPLGVQASKICESKKQQVWARQLADGSVGVGLFNLAQGAQVVGIDWSQLGIVGPHTVRDLWQHEDMGIFAERYSADVAEHGSVLLKITPCS